MEWCYFPLFPPSEKISFLTFKNASLFAGMMTLFHTIHFDDATRTYVSAWRSVTQLERSQIEWKPYLVCYLFIFPRSLLLISPWMTIP